MKKRQKKQPELSKDQKSLNTQLEQIAAAKKLSERLRKLPTKKGKDL